jgi:hypothetical protein
MPPATTVLALVLLSWTAGTIVLGAATRTGGRVDDGHFKVVWLVSAAMAVLAGFAHHWVWALAALCAVTAWRRELTIPAAAGGLGALATARPLAFAACAALLLGSVTNAMLLGHWHLNQPKLGTTPLRNLVRGVFAGVVAFAVACVIVLRDALDHERDTAIVGAITGLAFVSFAAVLAAMVAHLVRTRSIMSATGILYLAILLAFVAVFTGSLGALAR